MATATVTRKDQITITARNLFREKGYKSTSMRNLAQCVGIEAASLYSHVKSKEEILQKICFGLADKFMAAMQDAQSKTWTADKKLAYAIDKHIEVVTNNLDASGVFIHDWKHLSEPSLAKFKQMRSKYENFFIGLVDDGIKQKRFRDVNAKFAVMTLFNSMNWIYDHYKPNGKMKQSEISQELSLLFLNGLSK
jgi:TetR/AcrR family transcriptional regulator, cholesterol catabolism regulator